MELVDEKRRSVESIMPDLSKKFLHRPTSEEAFMHRGYEGQKNIWRDMLRVGEDVLIIGAKAQWFDPRLDSARVAFYRETKRKKMTFHLLLDNEIKTKLPNFTKTYPGFMKCRFLPKESSTSAIIVIFGEYVVMYSGVGIMKMSDDTAFFVVRSKNLSDGYKKWFKYMWEELSADKK